MLSKTASNPSRDAKFCVSQASIPQTDSKQYATYNDFPCVSQATMPQTDALQYTTYKYVFIPRETQDFASLQGSRHQYKILLTLLMRYCMPYPYVPSSLAIRNFWLSAKALFSLHIVFFFYIFPMIIKYLRHSSHVRFILYNFTVETHLHHQKKHITITIIYYKQNIKTS